MLFRSFAALSLPRLPASAQTPSHASAEDCAVIAAIGEEKMQWHQTRPDMAMYAKSYGADCDWKALGIKHFDIPALGPGPYYAGVRFSFSQPSYSADKLEATLTYSVGGNGGPTQYFYSLSYCAAKKTNGAWHPAGCKPGPIT